MADNSLTPTAINHETMTRLYLAVRGVQPRTAGHDQIEVFSQTDSSLAEGTVTTVPTCFAPQLLISTAHGGCAPYGVLSGGRGTFSNNYYLESITQVSAIRGSRPYAVKINLEMISECRDSSSPPVDARCAVTFTEGFAPVAECSGSSGRDYYSDDLFALPNLSDQILRGLETYRNMVLQSENCETE